jgi:hypothetical protein
LLCISKGVGYRFAFIRFPPSFMHLPLLIKSNEDNDDEEEADDYQDSSVPWFYIQGALPPANNRLYHLIFTLDIVFDFILTVRPFLANLFLH